MSSLNSLIEAERAFSSMASSKGMRQAFLSFLAPEGLIFRPHPVNGKKWYEDHPELGGFLTWEPAFADISASGEFGYTTGPWEYRKDPTEEAIAFGHYVSVWKIQAETGWKVVADIGIQCLPSMALRRLSFSDGIHSKAEPPDDGFLKMKLDALTEADKHFTSAAIREGLMNALNLYAAEGIRMFRMDTVPLDGRQAIRAFGSDETKFTSGELISADISLYGDLGYVLGETTCRITDTENKAIYYLRIWENRANSDWRLVLDIAN